MGGDSMLRPVGRAVVPGVGRGTRVMPSSASGARPSKPASTVPFPSSSSSSSSSPPPSFITPTTMASSYSHPSLCNEEEKPFNFGPVPSKEEVEEAVSALKRLFLPVTYSQVFGDGFPSPDKNATGKMLASTELMERVSSAEMESNWIKSAQQLHYSKLVQSQGQERVFDAFRLLQSNPSVQRMVVSLSSDKAVWDAVMKNKVVQELQKPFYAERSKRQGSNGCPDVGTIILSWILENTKAKIMEFIDKIAMLVNELFHSHEREKSMDLFDDVVRSSFMLSVMVFIIVIVTRVK